MATDDTNDEGLRVRRDILEELWQALESTPEKALRLAKQRESEYPDDPEIALVVAITLLESEQVKAARDRLESLAGLELEGNLEYQRIWYLGHALFFLGQPQQALDQLYILEPADRGDQASLSWWRGLCHDALGERKRADSAFEESRRLDPEGAPPAPIPITSDDIERIVKLVAARLPDPVRAALDELPVVIDDLPSLDLVRSSGGGVAPDTLGLYVGHNLMERSFMDPVTLPPQIFLYRRNLERFARSRDDLVRQIEITLLHELGHHLGYEEEGLDDLGLA